MALHNASLYAHINKNIGYIQSAFTLYCGDPDLVPDSTFGKYCEVRDCNAPGFLTYHRTLNSTLISLIPVYDRKHVEEYLNCYTTKNMELTHGRQRPS